MVLYDFHYSSHQLNCLTSSCDACFIISYVIIKNTSLRKTQNAKEFEIHYDANDDSVDL